MVELSDIQEVIHKWAEGLEYAEEGDVKDAQVLLTRPYSVHPDDWYLSVVLAYLPNNDITPYVVWGCNVSFGDIRYFHGDYFKEKEAAFETWKAR